MIVEIILSIIEIKLETVELHSFSVYLDSLSYRDFDNQVFIKEDDHKKLIEILSMDIERNESIPFISHYKNNYSEQYPIGLFLKL